MAKNCQKLSKLKGCLINHIFHTVNGMEKAAAASKLEWMMQQTSSALASLEKIDDNGNGFKWLAGQNPSWSEKKGSMSLKGRNYQNHTKNSEICL